MEAMAVHATMGTVGEAAATLLLRRAAEGFFWAKAYLNAGNLPYISLAEIWSEARELTDARIERLGLSIDPVPPRCRDAGGHLLEQRYHAGGAVPADRQGAGPTGLTYQSAGALDVDRSHTPQCFEKPGLIHGLHVVHGHR